MDGLEAKLDVDKAVNDRTIIYYTANSEDPVFEQRIRDCLVENSKGIPIISVSRKPINLGLNICVGEQPISYANEWKQLLIGLKAAKTKYCLTAEADCIYPPEYFTFIPPDDDVMYYYDNIYVVWKYKNAFWKKPTHCEGAGMCNREYWISRLDSLITYDWNTVHDRKAELWIAKQFFSKEDIWTGDPVVTFKTRDGMRNKTVYISEKIKSVPYWGHIRNLRHKFFAPE